MNNEQAYKKAIEILHNGEITSTKEFVVKCAMDYPLVFCKLAGVNVEPTITSSNKILTPIVKAKKKVAKTVKTVKVVEPEKVEKRTYRTMKKVKELASKFQLMYSPKELNLIKRMVKKGSTVEKITETCNIVFYKGENIRTVAGITTKIAKTFKKK